MRAGRRFLKSILCAGAAPLVLAAPAALAQTATSPASTSQASASQASGGAGPETLSEVVVTAQKRTENVQSVPAQVSVVSALELEQLHATSLADFGAYVPGLQVNSGGTPGQTTLSLRGIAPIGPSATVGTYIDDTPVGSTSVQAEGSLYSLDLLPYDVQRIEVLQGPQGTLYGANSLGGLIKYVLTPPSLTDYQARIGGDVFGVSGAGDPGGGGRAMLTGPIIADRLGLLASYASENTPGYIDNALTGQKDQNAERQQTGRLALLFRPTPQVSIQLGALFQKIDAKNNAFVAIDPTSLRPVSGELTNNNYIPEPSRSTLQHYSAEINWDLGWGKLVSATSYSMTTFAKVQDNTRAYGFLYPLFKDAAGNPDPAGIAPFYADLITKKVTQEFRLSSPTTNRLEWLVGAFYTHEDNKNNQDILAETFSGQTIDGLNPLLSAQLPDVYNEYAVFGDITFHLTDKLDIAGGLRYAHNDQEFPVTAKGLLLEFEGLSAGTTSLFQSSSEGVLTYNFNPRYHITKDILTYIRIASGYQAGGPNIPYPGVPGTVKSDTLTNYEFGFKSEFLQHRAQIDIAAFYIDWKDIQIEGFLPGTGFTYLDNGGTAKSEGVSLDGLLRPFSGLTLSGNVTYTDAVLTQDVPQINGVSGDRLPYIPRWSGAIQVDYAWPLTSEVRADVGGGVRLVSNRYDNVPHNPDAYVFGAYDAVDLHARLDYSRYSIGLFVKNAGNTRAYNYDTLIQNALTGSTSELERTIIQPRTVGVSVDAKF